MCAIAGILNINGEPVGASQLQRMTDVMAHRGPDGQGVFVDRNLGLGHRRLSIIDLSPAANQPMSNENGTIWLVFNGEIYNYLELIPILQARGHIFKSRSDSEVIIHGYEEWGEECVEQFNGMWAFAIWDATKNRVFLSRDRFGVKPLYYYWKHGRFYFASEIKAILSVVPEGREPCYPYLYHFMSSSGLLDDGEETFFQNIKSLLPAHSLVIGEDEFRLKNYWQYDPEKASKRYDYGNPEATFRDLLRDSVRLRLRSDVPVGTCLSGGLDSSAIVALASGMMEHPVKTFSCLYDDEECNEAYFVDRMNSFGKTHPYPVYPSGKDLFEVLPKIVWHQDQPSAGPGLYSQWHVMKEAQGRVKVLLDGQGGDELLGGYHTYFGPFLSSLTQDFIKNKQLATIFSILRSLRRIRRLTSQPAIRPYLKLHLPWPIRAFMSRARRLARRVKMNNGGNQPPILHPDFVDAVKGRTLIREYPVQFDDALNNTLYWQLVSQSIPALLHYEDRNSMAFSIEARTPFLDYRLVEFCLGLPYELKIREGITKFILRKSLKHDLPKEIIGREDKKGYPTPMARWFRESEKVKMQEILYSPEVRRRKIFNLPGIQDTVVKHCQGKIDASWEIYRWLTVELWFRAFID